MEAFEDLVEAARPRLWRAYVATRGLDGADEAVSEALSWAWEHRDRVATMSNPIGYLYRVGLTRTAAKRKPVLPAPVDVGLPEVEPDLIPAMLALPGTQRTAVWLVHGCGWSYGEVAEAMGIGRSTVGTHVSRGLAALRERLEVAKGD
ncbi:MAG: sigma-70 family RNA polymerase sigma factor [bacterium]|nr:sigma-70 family RNA polymerase sigma factor [bacterium]